MARHMYIAVEGAIGVGKTTLARLMQRDFEAELLLEVFEENPFLKDFYRDRARYAFQTQMFFLLSRYWQQQSIGDILERSNLISDYTFAKDSLFARLNLKGDELAMYERMYAILSERIPLPNLIVYLKADTSVLIERISLRDRSYERNMDRGYIDGLNKAYEAFLGTHTQAPVLPIDTNNLNIVKNREHLNHVVQRIRSELGLGVYQRTLPEV